MDYYEKALKVKPQNSHALHGKADCCRGLMRYSSAIKVWRAALGHGMDPRIAMTRIGDAYMSLDDLQNAEANYRKALDLGHDQYAYLGLARIHARRHHMDRALKVLSMIVEKWPENSRIASEIRRFAREYPQIEKALH